MTEEQLFERGLQRRREVLGGEYVELRQAQRQIATNWQTLYKKAFGIAAAA